MPSTYSGRLERFAGSWASGLGFLVFDDGTAIPCENAATVRALEDCFGNVIASGHAASSDSFSGREIVYSIDDFGMLLGFVPAEKWRAPEDHEEQL